MHAVLRKTLITILVLTILLPATAAAREIRITQETPDGRTYSVRIAGNHVWVESGRFAATGSGRQETMGVRAWQGDVAKLTVGSSAGVTRGGSVWGGLGLAGSF